MAYQHIDNLYKNRDVLLFRECYAMEKIHGSSAHVSWKEGGRLEFFAGGCKHAAFVELFDEGSLTWGFQMLGHPEVTVFGEAYGGKCQRMSDTYGKALRFVAFDVKVGDCWLVVPSAAQVATELGLDFVAYIRGPTTLEFLDAQRDTSSVQAHKNGIEGDRRREGIVIRPPIEVRKNNGERIIAKHKAEFFRETRTPRPMDAAKLATLEAAEAIAEEWVTEMRLAHVLDQFGPEVDITQTGDIIRAMTADVEREAEGEITVSREARTAIGKRTAQMVRARFQARLAAAAGGE